uniref:Uncharacterized protein n=1 Tax=Pyrodinium bahamense TaxID=73915 RepID=A0A7S0A327_9DINO|mmetsp:Transcript_20638/g.56971  ORF Transcript_20638/g.56971 Transcript_20638/m.56971 type:complete len:597 (+) Transcript_20638:65-1855(+)|eukprot:CAMPEP_0179150712 /NCGR_PEP_ID=MMETSP0796-20121207/73115_1 /TAXON_ID=73915 /ORGANISM="Pyrodinium bahamense, Strain pbaha01" /LENGTH=596 /DNA_ID=CAMNT_0020851719 /DNA_START=53 /DNA_END=1843 /DNA_ORIENTATION=+
MAAQAMVGQAAPAEVEAFFDGLPQARLTPHETALRQALMDFVQARWPKPFPLSEWIDRRVGGELEIRRNEAGQEELFLRGAGQPPPSAGGATTRMDRDTFFSSLDPSAFAPEEDALRDSVFEFLARWKSRELATLTDLSNDAGVRRQTAAFLPPDVPLKEWVEQRIGGEVEFKPDARGQEIVHLTPSARPFVTAKYEQIAATAVPAGKGHGGFRQQPGRQTMPPPAQTAQLPNAPSRDAFFLGLPPSELTPGELALRSALLEYLDVWPRVCVQFGKPAGSCPLLSDLGQDPHVQRCRNNFLPPNIALKDWIDRRIGGEIELRKDDKGQFELWLRGAAPPKVKRGPSRARGREDAERRVNSMESAEDFISKLPSDAHTDAEADLRQAILDYLEDKVSPVQLSEACKDRRVSQCRSALLPPEVPLRIWIDRRIGGEVETMKDDLGRYVLQMRGGSKVEADVGPEKEQFFANLPPDGFTPDEEQLREAILDLLNTWKAKEPPTLSHAGGDPRVKKFRVKVLPKGVPVTLRDWIDRRIGGEVEMFESPTGQLHFGLRGQVNQASQARKRGAGPGADGQAPWKKGGDGRGGAPQDRSGSWN